MHRASKSNSVTAAAALMGAVMLSQTALAATVKSPSSLVTCQPIAIDWSEAPASDIFLSVIPGGKESEPALVDLGKYSGSSGSVTWTVNLAADTEITLKLVDSTGLNSFSSPVTIQAGPDTSCIGQPAVVKAGSPSAASSGGDSSSSSISTATTSTSSVSSGSSIVSSSINTTGGNSSSTLNTGSTESTTLSGSTTTSLPSTSIAGFNATGTPGAAFASFQLSGAMIGLAGLASAMVVLA